MKKLFKVGLAFIASVAFCQEVSAAQQSVTTISPGTGTSGLNLKTYTDAYINPRLTIINSNDTDLYTNKADKSTVALDWGAYATGFNFTVNAIVSYQGQFYKCIQEYVKSPGDSPAAFASYWQVIGGSAGAVAIDDLTDVDTTGKATGKILKFNSSGNLVVGDDSTGSGSIPSGTVTGQVLRWATDTWAAEAAPWLLPNGSGADLTDTFTGTLLGSTTTHKTAIQAIATELDNAVEITAGSGITISSGAISVTTNTYQAYDADWLGVTSNGASLVNAASYAAMRTLLDLEAGVDFYSISAADTAFQEAAGPVYPTSVSTSTATGDINIDGVSADHYYFNNGASTATYTPVITSPPASGKERAVVLTVGGGSGVITMTWTNVSFIGTAGASTTTASKYSHYGCFIPSSGNAKCKIIAEASDY